MTAKPQGALFWQNTKRLKASHWLPTRVPFFENATEGSVEGLSAGLQEKVRAPSGVHCICCFLQKRLLIKTLTVDSTKEVEINSPLRRRSP